jgi:hypothetical protein
MAPVTQFAMAPVQTSEQALRIQRSARRMVAAFGFARTPTPLFHAWRP